MTAAVPSGTDTLDWPDETAVQGSVAAVPARNSIASVATNVSVNPSKRAVAAFGVAARRGNMMLCASDAGVVAVAATLILRFTSAAAFAAGIREAIFNSSPVIFVHVVPLVLLCIPGVMPVTTSLAKSIASPVGALDGPFGTAISLDSEKPFVAVAAVLTSTFVAVFPNTGRCIVVAVALVHVVPLFKLNSIAVVTPVIASLAALYTAFGCTNLRGTVTLKAVEAKLAFVALTLT